MAKSEKWFSFKSMGKRRTTRTWTTTESTEKKLVQNCFKSSGYKSIWLFDESHCGVDAFHLCSCLSVCVWVWMCLLSCHWHCRCQMDVPSPHAICITWKLIQIKLLTLAFTTWYDLLSQSLVVAVATADTVCLFIYLRFFPSQFPPKQITKQNRTEQARCSKNVFGLKFAQTHTEKGRVWASEWEATFFILNDCTLYGCMFSVDVASATAADVVVAAVGFLSCHSLLHFILALFDIQPVSQPAKIRWHLHSFSSCSDFQMLLLYLQQLSGSNWLEIKQSTAQT